MNTHKIKTEIDYDSFEDEYEREYAMKYVENAYNVFSKSELQKATNKHEYFSTSVKTIDRLMKGFEKTVPEAYLIAGLRGHGVTSLAMQFTKALIRQGETVLYLAYEDGKAMTAERMILSAANVTLKDFMIMDVSLMFGLGNEPDAGELKRMFPSTWYAYTGKNGKFIDVNLTDKSRYISQSYQCWDGSYEEQATKLVSKNIPVMPSQQYVFQWLSRDNINTGSVRLIKYYDAGDGSALVNMGTSVVSSSDFFTTGNANLIVMEIDAVEGRTLAQAKNNLDRIRITPYNAYNSKVTDTEYWYQSKQLVPNGVTESLKSTPSTNNVIDSNF